MQPVLGVDNHKDGTETKPKKNSLWYHITPKSLQIVTAAMKLKDACSLEEKLWPI